MKKLPPIIEVLSPAPKKRGRKPGSGKVPGSGRKLGSGNKVPTDLREMILLRGKPLELLCDIARGVKIRVGPQAGPGDPQFQYPTLQERAAAAKILVDKLVPAASPISPDSAAEKAAPEREMTDIDAVRAMAFIINRGRHERGEPLITNKTKSLSIDVEPSEPAAAAKAADPFIEQRAVQAAEIAETKSYSTYDDAVAAQTKEDRLAIAECRPARQVPVFVEPRGSWLEHGMEQSRPRAVSYNPRHRR